VIAYGYRSETNNNNSINKVPPDTKNILRISHGVILIG
jgi:hypothetical protein